MGGSPRRQGCHGRPAGPVLERATVRTNEIERMVTEQALATGVGEEDVVRQFLHRNLIKRLIDPVDVAETIVFLCRADMWSITGQTINMDAGWLAT